MAWLLDTNILSEGRKPKPEPRVTSFYNTQPLNDLYISVVNMLKFVLVLSCNKIYQDALS